MKRSLTTHAEACSLRRGDAASFRALCAPESAAVPQFQPNPELLCH